MDTLLQDFSAREAAIRAHDCEAYDWHGQRHVHCQIDGAVVNVTTDPDGIDDILDGIRCASCREIVCTDCARESLCKDCADDERERLQRSDEIVMTACNAAKEIRSCLALIRAERDPGVIRSTISAIAAVEDAMTELFAALPREIERATGAQQVLPMAVA